MHKNIRKCRIPQTIALLTIFKNIGKTIILNNVSKHTSFTKKFIVHLNPSNKNIKNTDINKQLHFKPFSKTYVKPTL
jgi:hypothetical protein